MIDGRRWRRTDPELADEVAAALRSHLGRARAAVRTAKKGGDEEALREARSRVGLAKTGLGERGPRWWEEPIAERRRRAAEALQSLADD
ncbi:biopolymer transporter Tol [Schumannella luteola]|nr:biopolymer transporter Tol [Schumannella luteola]